MTTYQQWCEHNPTNDEAYYHLATLAQQLGQFDMATKAWLQLLTRHPDSPAIYNNLGNVQLAQGQGLNAQQSYQKAVQLNPDFAIGWYNLGRVYQQQGQSNLAWDCLQKSLHLAPQFADLHNTLGIWHQHQQQPKQALAAYQEALRLNPDLAEAHNNLGALLYEQKKVSQAIDCYQQALQRSPDCARTWQNLGNALKEQGDVNAAREAYERALSLGSDDALEIRLALLLPPIYAHQNELNGWRQRYQASLTKLKQRPLQVSDPVAAINATNFYLPYQGLADGALQQELAQLYLHACPDLAFTAPHVGQYHQRRPLRLGFISHHLRNHTIGKLMRGLIKQLAACPEFELMIFFAGPTQDPLANEIRQSVPHTIELPYQWQPARDQICQAQPDILFYPDLGMEPLTYFLAFSRLATLQCTTWGHPLTSGIPAMDVFFSSHSLETPASLDQYTEQLLLLQHLLPCYAQPQRPQSPARRQDYGLPEKGNLYVCAQSLFKFHPDFDAILGGILRQDPHGIIVLLSGTQPQWQQRLYRRWQITLPDVLTRLVFVPRQAETGYLNLLRLADVVLDPLHFGGGNTSYEALAMGTPIVTLPSAFLKGRLTYAMCQQMNWNAGVVHSPAEYVEQALKLAQDRDYNQLQRHIIGENSPRLFEDPVTVSQVAESLLALWQARV